jgi:hypothetical protein
VGMYHDRLAGVSKRLPIPIEDIRKVQQQYLCQRRTKIAPNAGAKMQHFWELAGAKMLHVVQHRFVHRSIQRSALL